MRTRMLVGVVVLLTTLVAVPTAAASRGVAIDLGRITVTQKLTPGGSYTLPNLGVRNPGTVATDYEMTVSGIADTGTAPSRTWFHFAPSHLVLKPKGHKIVTARLTIPTDAEPGDYTALVGPQIVSSGTGAQVGAGAAARLTFTVEPANALQAWWIRIKQFFTDNAPWSYVVVGLLLAAIVGSQFRRRFSFRLERRPT